MDMDSIMNFLIRVYLCPTAVKGLGHLTALAVNFVEEDGGGAADV
jgi:hypothetical protein